MPAEKVVIHTRTRTIKVESDGMALIGNCVHVYNGRDNSEPGTTSKRKIVGIFPSTEISGSYFENGSEVIESKGKPPAK